MIVLKIRSLYYQTKVGVDQKKAFEFCSNPKNIAKLSPEKMKVKINKADKIEMKQGTIINVRMKLFGWLPLRWQTKIEIWEPYTKFVDIQPKGPYRHWKHVHIFENTSSGTIIKDKIEFVVPGWLFEPFIYHLFVKRSLKAVFDHRQNVYRSELC